MIPVVSGRRRKINNLSGKKLIKIIYSLKPPSKMDQMRGDMGGAANVASAIWALAKLKVPVNVKGFIPLCENMPGNKATKPGDVIYGRNGKSVCIDNTDAEGRLILADALSYASE